VAGRRRAGWAPRPRPGPAGTREFDAYVESLRARADIEIRQGNLEKKP